MIEPWLGAIILITVFLLVLAFYAGPLPTVTSREERERSEILAILRRIGAALNREMSESPESPESPDSPGKVTPDAPTQNPKDRHEEND